ncbi:terpene synthase family protein [Streptomyces subrutilus]|nr:hypothetical protein [Streptomyces subrutilus]
MHGWARRMGLVPDPAEFARLARMRLGTWAGYVHPLGTPGELALAAEWVAFICLVDDVFDSDELAADDRPQAVHELLADLLQVLDGTSSGRERPNSPYVRALNDLWQRTAPTASPGWAGRFTADYRDFAAASVAEARLRQQATPLGLQEYLALRRQSITMLPALHIGEAVSHIELPDQWRTHDVVGALRQTVVDAVGYGNDIASAESEHARGQDNLISILHREQTTSRDQAYAIARAMLHERLRHFDATASHLTAPGGSQTQSTTAPPPMVLAYAQMLQTWMRGTLQWSFETARFVPDTAQDKARRPEDGGHEG